MKLMLCNRILEFLTYVFEIVETMKHWTQQQFGKIELDSLSEALTRGLKLITHVRLG